jgi:hypothetical protein
MVNRKDDALNALNSVLTMQLTLLLLIGLTFMTIPCSAVYPSNTLIYLIPLSN